MKIRISAVMPSGHLCGLVDRREMEGGGASKKNRGQFIGRDCEW